MGKKWIFVFVMGIALSGCVRPSLYNWGGYSQSMYAFYQSPEENEKFIDTLNAIITTNENAGTLVPPGIYAEYGYMMLSAGKSVDAIDYFTKEFKTWPEAKPFMNTMIKLAKNDRKNKKATQLNNPIGAADVDLVKKGG